MINMKTTPLFLNPSDFSEPPGCHHVHFEQQRTFAKRPPIFKSYLRLQMTVLMGALALLMLLFSAPLAQAVLYTVTNGTDTPTAGTLTLRQAVALARTGDEINFNLPAGTTINLSQGTLELDYSVTVTGPGANLLTVQADPSHQYLFPIFYITFVPFGDSQPTQISGLSIAGGMTGVIVDEREVTLAGCAIANNVNSSSTPYGGGIYNNSYLTLVNSTVSQNVCTNTSSGPFVRALGGGIYNRGSLTVTNSTISGNLAHGFGGGIYNVTGLVTLTNSTVAENLAEQTAADPDGDGGGIFNDTFGTAYTQGDPNSTVTIRNTIIAKNVADRFGNDADGPFVSQGYNLIGDTNSTTITGTTTGNQLNVNPQLGPLQNNGGPTKTYALLSGSPAIDKGSSGGTTTDQRGLTRPVDDPNIPNAVGGDGSDIGAVEKQSVCEFLVTNNNDSGTGSLRDATANVCTGGSIIFSGSVVSPINLTSELVIPRAMTIRGPGANLMTVQRSASASTNFSVFHVSAGGYVIISGLTITRGNPQHNGGGLYVDNASTLFLENCAVTNNQALTLGALPANGGGIATGGIGTPSVIIISSTISDNSATQDGGGISAASLTVDTSTISGNTAARYGGGISVAGTTNIVNSTIANNSAAVGGGLRGNGYSVTTSNSIFAKNTATTTDPDFSGTLTSHGYNLIGNNTGTTITGTTTGNQLNVNPLLGPLQDNGGPTNTCALLTGSPAIDQGQPYAITLADQRGAYRPYDDSNIPNAPGGNGSDIGAFEVSTLTPSSAVSRKIQGTATFDINLPFTGSPGIECRSGGATNDYQVLFYFAGPVTFNSAAITAGTGTVSSTSGGGGETYVIVNLAGVTNAQRITVTLLGASNGVNTADTSVQMAVLVGDTNGNGSVNSSDISQTKSQSGQPVTGSNFREDVNTNGSINSSDVSLVKSKSGSALP